MWPSLKWITPHVSLTTFNQFACRQSLSEPRISLETYRPSSAGERRITVSILRPVTHLLVLAENLVNIHRPFSSKNLEFSWLADTAKWKVFAGCSTGRWSLLRHWTKSDAWTRRWKRKHHSEGGSAARLAERGLWSLLFPAHHRSLPLRRIRRWWQRCVSGNETFTLFDYLKLNSIWNWIGRLGRSTSAENGQLVDANRNRFVRQQMRRAGISGSLHSNHALFGLDPLQLDRQLKSLVVSFLWISVGFFCRFYSIFFLTKKL